MTSAFHAKRNTASAQKHRGAAVAFMMLLLFFGARASALHAQTSATAADDTAFDTRARELNQQLRCPVCQGSSIQESPSPEAQSMKAIVRERLAAGQSDEQIKAYFVSRYGEWILLKPPAHGINLLVYILPILVLLAGAAFVYRTARKWTAPA